VRTKHHSGLPPTSIQANETVGSCPNNSLPQTPPSATASRNREDAPSIDPFVEDVFPVSQAPKRIRGRRVHPSTVWRWVQRGIGGYKLETIKVGGVTCTSEAALLRFFSALTKAPPALPPAKVEAVRQAQIERELKAYKL
jgi:Protein of unknown function (DUF1580)